MRTKWSALPLSLAVLYSGLHAGLAAAATPASGTVTDRNTSTSYTAGPFLVPNVSGTSGTVTCNVLMPCDAFTLKVDVPATYSADHNLTVRVQWPNSAADFDLYVLDQAGNVLGSAASSSDPEVAVLPAVSGTYTVRVVPFTPLGDSINATIELTAKPLPGTPGSTTPPSYTNYQPPAGSNLGTTAGEPSIGANWKSGKVMFQSNTQTLRVSFNDSVTPASALWEAKSAAPPSCTAVTGLDPILWTDSILGRSIESQLLANPVLNSLSCYTDNDGETWVPSQGGGLAQGIDHQTIGGGPFAASLAPPLATYQHAVYYCSQSLVEASCARSDNGGLTYGPSIPVYTIQQCGGLHGHVKVAPDGTVYLPNKGCGGQQAVAVSTDNGLTWSLRKIPNSSAGDSDPSVGIGSDGTVYFGYQNGDGHPRVAVSRDRGITWTDDQDISAPFGVQNVAFPAVVAGDADRAAFAYLGTTTAGNYQDAGFAGLWHLYVAHTYDGGKSWVTRDAIPADPVQAGCIWMGGGSNPCRNLLDFMDATVDAQGRVLVGYADGCTLACAASPAPIDDPAHGYHTQLASIARQLDGQRLFARFDLADLVIESVRVSQPGAGSAVTATVANKGRRAASEVSVKFLDGNTAIGTSAPVKLDAGARAEVSIPLPPDGLHGSHVLTIVADPSNSVPESDEANNKLRASIYLQ